MVKISGFKIGNAEVQLEGGEGASLRQICDALGIQIDGQTFVVNGTRAHGPDAIVRDGSTIEVLPKPRAGTEPAPVGGEPEPVVELV